MKKLMILPVLMFFYACSTDSMDFEQDQYNNALTTMASNEAAGEAVPDKATLFKPCYKGLSSHIYVDVSNGFGNPIVVFQTVVPSGVPSTVNFRVRAEIQPLSDCDDMDSLDGTPVLFGSTGFISNLASNPPSIEVLPSQLPSCYKWRLVYEGYTVSFKKPTCISYTSWQEAPLF